MLKEWKDMTEEERLEAYKALLSRVGDNDKPWENPKCPHCGLYIDWVTFTGTCYLKTKVVRGQADWKTTEVNDWEPNTGVKELFCYNCGEDVHTLIKES
jgi:hypothetical protein